MPAETFRAEHSAIPTAFDQRRRSERRVCDQRVLIRTEGGDLPANLTDISAGGIGIRIDALMALRPGARLLLIHPQLGEVPCQLRWAMHPRYGAEFHAGTHALGRVRALYDSLPPGEGEII